MPDSIDTPTDSPPGYLAREELLTLVRLAPLVSIDLVVRDEAGRVLVGLRRNQPARGYWFVPGGRVLKGESLDAAFARLTRTELGTTRQRRDASLLGVYEHRYDTNFADVDGVDTHYVVLAYQLLVSSTMDIRLDEQHKASCWLLPEELLQHPDVHANTRAYIEQVTVSPGGLERVKMLAGIPVYQ
jgi:colanic acid biosynthesis protein WcaH